MRIVTITWLRNEGDIVEAFVRHHSRFAHRMILVDNGSKDSTLAIIRSLQAEGLPIDLEQDSSMTHTQSEAMTAAMRRAVHTYNPDWILPLDADEFFVAADGSDPIKIIET